MSAPARARAGSRRRRPKPVLVLKLGGSVLDGPAGYRAAAAEIGHHLDRDRRVVAVVSAPHGFTEELLAIARGVAECPRAVPLSELLATGEAASGWLLAIALRAGGRRAGVLSVRDLGLRTTGARLDAFPVTLDRERLTRELTRRQIVIVPGYVGLDGRGRTTLLGRGGSDLTALFVARILGAAECVLIKDVDGLHDADPNLRPDACRLGTATWRELLRFGADLVQPKAVRFAARHRLGFRIAALGGAGTRVTGSFTAHDRPVTMNRNV